METDIIVYIYCCDEAKLGIGGVMDRGYILE